VFACINKMHICSKKAANNIFCQKNAEGPNIYALDAGFHKQPPRACCGAPGQGPYNFNLTAKCGERGATACADPKTHWSWDGIHLTEAAYGHIARGWLHGPFTDEPIIQSS
jgi:hypothetical protein